MAVTSCTFLRERSGGYDSSNRGTYQVQYRFTTDSDMGVRGVANGCLSSSPDSIPNFGTAYDFESKLGSGEEESTSYAQSYSVQFDPENKRRGIISVTFSPLEDGESPRDRQAYNSSQGSISNVGGTPDYQNATQPAEVSGTTAPWRRGPTFWFDEEAYTAIVDEDKDGNAIVNSAGKPFDRPPTMELTRGVLVAEFNVATLREVVTLNRTYCNAVNSTAWTIFSGSGFTNPPARSAVCRYCRSGKPVFEGGYSYYPIQMVFAFKEDGGTWDLRILNEDAAGYLTTGDDLDTYTTPEPNQAPYLLAADGTELGTAAGTYSSFRVRSEVDFNAAPLSNYLTPT